MLYIENIDYNNLRLGNAAGGGTYTKTLPKTLQARKDELNRIYIWHEERNEQVVQLAKVSELSLDGTVYSTAEAFVVAFNNLCGKSISGVGGTTDASVEYNTPAGGEVTGSSYTIAANTAHSVTLTCTVGTAAITFGTNTINMVAGQTMTWQGDGLIDTAITINTTAGATYSVDYNIMGAATTTTTTTATPTTTTTTTAAATTTTTTAAA